MPDFMNYYSPSNSMRLQITPRNDSNNLSLELFLFPNLSLSPIAKLTIILKFADRECPVKIFADLSTVSWSSLYVADEYPVTNRKYIIYNGKKCYLTTTLHIEIESFKFFRGNWRADIGRLTANFDWADLWISKIDWLRLRMSRPLRTSVVHIGL